MYRTLRLPRIVFRSHQKRADWLASGRFGSVAPALPWVGHGPTSLRPASSSSRREETVTDVGSIRVSENNRPRFMPPNYTLGGDGASTPRVVKAADSPSWCINEEFRFRHSLPRSTFRSTSPVLSAGVTGSAQHPARVKLSVARTESERVRRSGDGIFPVNTNGRRGSRLCRIYATVERCEVIKGPAGTLFAAHKSRRHGETTCRNRPKANAAATVLYSVLTPTQIVTLTTDSRRMTPARWDRVGLSRGARISGGDDADRHPQRRTRGTTVRSQRPLAGPISSCGPRA
jgi:hypothetical protein